LNDKQKKGEVHDHSAIDALIGRISKVVLISKIEDILAILMYFVGRISQEKEEGSYFSHRCL
jgi:hypothetical protein